MKFGMLLATKNGCKLSDTLRGWALQRPLANNPRRPARGPRRNSPASCRAQAKLEPRSPPQIAPTKLPSATFSSSALPENRPKKFKWNCTGASATIAKLRCAPPPRSNGKSRGCGWRNYWHHELTRHHARPRHFHRPPGTRCCGNPVATDGRHGMEGNCARNHRSGRPSSKPTNLRKACCRKLSSSLRNGSIFRGAPISGFPSIYRNHRSEEHTSELQ